MPDELRVVVHYKVETLPHTTGKYYVPKKIGDVTIPQRLADWMSTRNANVPDVFFANLRWPIEITNHLRDNVLRNGARDALHALFPRRTFTVTVNQVIDHYQDYEEAAGRFIIVCVAEPVVPTFF